MNEREKLIYLAGIADGEGCFANYNVKNGRGKRYPRPMIIIVNTDRKMIYWIKKNFGGYIQLYPTGSDTRRECKPLYRWSIGNSKAVALAKELQPFLIVKREQVKRTLS